MMPSPKCPQPLLFSVLDLVPICEGQSFEDAFANAAELAQLAERCGYHRYWVAEHHGIPGVASAATAVVLTYLAGATQRIRIGAGGVMLPNHAPLVIAEQFGTLASLFPGRIDLGLGRAPGGDHATLRALRRSVSGGDNFPNEVLELMSYLGEAEAGQPVLAIPGQGTHVPIYLLGSSLFGARLAAELGLPFAFASHFAPDYLQTALRLYRDNFIPSAQLKAPYAMVGVNVIAADTDEEARYLFTTMQQSFLNLVRGRPGKMPPPVEALDWTAAEAAHVQRMTQVSAVGSPESLKKQLREILQLTQADEIVATGSVFDHGARLKSFEIAAGVFAEIAAG